MPRLCDFYVLGYKTVRINSFWWLLSLGLFLTTFWGLNSPQIAMHKTIQLLALNQWKLKTRTKDLLKPNITKCQWLNRCFIKYLSVYWFTNWPLKYLLYGKWGAKHSDSKSKDQQKTQLDMNFLLKGILQWQLKRFFIFSQQTVQTTHKILFKTQGIVLLLKKDFWSRNMSN